MTDDILVLYVDDSPALRDLTVELLERVNPAITVTAEENPTDVTERLVTEPIECVVSDLDMPSMDGLELCGRIRDRHPEVPFFLLTSQDGETVIEEALAAGVTDYIQKETGVEHYKLLANRISNAVQHYRDRTRLAELESGA